jgi:hypothetical protein
MGASQPDKIGRSDQLHLLLAFGMIILTNLMLMALTGTSSNLAVPIFSLNPVHFSQSWTYLVDTTRRRFRTGTLHHAHV